MVLVAICTSLQKKKSNGKIYDVNLLYIYSVSSLIRTSIIRILAYPNSQKQDYNIIHKHFNDIHIVIELSVIYFSMYFTYQLSELKYFCLHKGVRISEDAL